MISRIIKTEVYVFCRSRKLSCHVRPPDHTFYEIFITPPSILPFLPSFSFFSSFSFPFLPFFLPIRGLPVRRLLVCLEKNLRTTTQALDSVKVQPCLSTRSNPSQEFSNRIGVFFHIKMENSLQGRKFKIYHNKCYHCTFLLFIAAHFYFIAAQNTNWL